MTIIQWFLRLISPPCEACHRSLYEENLEQFTWCPVCQAFTATPATSSPRHTLEYIQHHCVECRKVWDNPAATGTRNGEWQQVVNASWPTVCADCQPPRRMTTCHQRVGDDEE